MAALESLVERQKDFDYILLETTGVADPGNIAPMFWMDEGLGSSIYLDGIVTVVDAKNILKSLDEPSAEEIPESESHEHGGDLVHNGPLMSTAHLQISHADVIILNKSDLVASLDLKAVEQRIASINAIAKIIPTTHSRVPSLSGTLLDLQAYSTFPSERAGPDFHTKGHSHLDPTISTITISIPQLDISQLPKLESWLQSILWEENGPNSYEIHRTKGLVPCTDGSTRVIQGVREIFEILVVDAAHDSDNEQMHKGKIVFIGRNLDKLAREWPDLE